MKKMLPLSVRRSISRQRNSIMSRLQGRVSHKGWDIILNDDVYLVSYPRSGNTWLRNIMTNLRFPDAEWDLQSLAVVFPDKNSHIDPALVPRPRWIRSHNAYDGNYPKVIYMVRDGRDVAASYYHWSGANEFQSFEDFLEETVLAPSSSESGSFFEAWHRHVSGWLDHQNENMIVVNYENLLSDPMIEIQRICLFVGLQRTSTEIEIALAKSTYEKQQKDFNNFKLFKNKSVGIKAGKGKWKDYFCSELLDKYWKVAGESMEKAGYAK